jgi:hypothetical protein
MHEAHALREFTRSNFYMPARRTLMKQYIQILCVSINGAFYKRSRL